MALALHLCMVVWPCMFQPHLLEKYDGSVNPAKFRYIYSTSILTVGGNEVIIANYFPVALTDTAWSWLMNLPEGSLTSWAELYCQFITNFKSVYAHLGNKVTSTPCNSARGSHYGPSSSGSPMFETPSSTSPMLML
jgi:hypothetical protein